ncbi:MAG TPA: DUF3147 family protein [Candidatus Dormibacteraeota bacterium]|nr:DUF3147 family protein [Candidatus Dormibacteraeota bacterium]
MKDILLLAVRVVAGGALVVAFAMLSDMLKPKMFSGLFGAAPSVATASLLVSGLAMGAGMDAKYATGMIAGAVGLVVYAGVAALAVKHLGPVAGSIVAWVAWVVPAAVIYLVFLR